MSEDSNFIKKDYSVCCYCDHVLSCAVCGKEQPNDESELTRLRAQVERAREALSQMLVDPPAALNEPDTDGEVIAKMRAIAKSALTDD